MPTLTTTEHGEIHDPTVRSREWPNGCGVSGRPRVRPLTLKKPVGGSLRGRRVVLMRPSCSRPVTREPPRKAGLRVIYFSLSFGS
jgi:hypothetical protein